jgi:beta-glucosidase
MTTDGNITASVTITNTGNCEGTEVVQLYIRDMVGSNARPVQELKGFERISLKPGESRTVTFIINSDLLKFYNKNLDYVCEPGDFEVMVGTNSHDVQRKNFTLK